MSSPDPTARGRMRLIRLAHEEDFDGWRAAARALAMAQVPGTEVSWQVGDGPQDLFAAESDAVPAGEGAFSVPRPFLALAQSVICHKDPERFALLYQLLLRLRTRPQALAESGDALIQRLERMAREVRRDLHRMQSMPRFHETAVAGSPRLVAWFEPEHHIVRSAAGHAARRCADIAWSIMTPGLCAHWDGKALTFSPGGEAAGEMTQAARRNMPETALVAESIEATQAQEADMARTSRAGIGDNARTAWEALRVEAKGCTRCHLYKGATQTVFGEGPVDARILFVGEQPGDQEDLAGRPFVGPAGQLFDQALAEAGIDRARTYVTNAVKHFKFERRGKRRIHQKPEGAEIEACRWWIEQERMLIRAPITVALGATAARSLFGKIVTISSTRGRAHALEDGGECWVTVHPSFLLRIPEAQRKAAEYARFVEDLARVKKRLTSIG